MRRRRRQAGYRAVRVDESRWDLYVDGVMRSSHLGYREAERVAALVDRKHRTRSAFVRHSVILGLACLLLVPVLLLREVDNPDYAPARAFADRMEQAYRAVDAGDVEIGSFSAEPDGVSGGVFEVDRGGVVADYQVLVGEHDGNCYVIRWVRGQVPFVARLLPRYPCEPGERALSFNPAGFEAIAVNLSADRPLEWTAVLPAETKLATWFFPAVFVLLFVVLQRLVALSLLAIRGVTDMPLEVDRVEGPDA